MNCPHCNQPASTFFESMFSLRGVSISEAIRMYFKCRNCGTLLQHTGFGKETTIFLTASVAVLAILTQFEIFLPLVGLVAYGLLVLIGFAYCFWKYGKIAKVNPEERTA
ncbi:MAG TPA: hypothetical protein VNN76_01320 [Bacteroidota bacterium]|nr:hypothetical protein [Bacteroidota bacterium]